jgi:hypothetical protein
MQQNSARVVILAGLENRAADAANGGDVYAQPGRVVVRLDIRPTPVRRRRGGRAWPV